MATTEQASLPLRVLVVGGSIAGLACAYTLSKAGHNVRVLEQSEAAVEVSHCIPHNVHTTDCNLGIWGHAHPPKYEQASGQMGPRTSTC